jgi:hypothetical protein
MSSSSSTGERPTFAEMCQEMDMVWRLMADMERAKDNSHFGETAEALTSAITSMRNVGRTIGRKIRRDTKTIFDSDTSDSDSDLDTLDNGGRRRLTTSNRSDLSIKDIVESKRKRKPVVRLDQYDDDDAGKQSHPKKQKSGKSSKKPARLPVWWAHDYDDDKEEKDEGGDDEVDAGNKGGQEDHVLIRAVKAKQHNEAARALSDGIVATDEEVKRISVHAVTHRDTTAALDMIPADSGRETSPHL